LSLLAAVRQALKNASEPRSPKKRFFLPLFRFSESAAAPADL